MPLHLAFAQQEGQRCFIDIRLRWITKYQRIDVSMIGFITDSEAISPKLVLVRLGNESARHLCKVLANFIKLSRFGYDNAQPVLHQPV